MKTYILLLLLVISITISAQKVACIDYTLYNSNYEVEQVHQEKTPLNSVKELGIETQDDQLQLVVLPNALVPFSKWSAYTKKNVDKGFKIFIINTTKQPINISNIDGVITFTRQVYYKDEWRTITSFDKKPRVIRCGNSFLSNKIIEPKEVQTFIAPCISGDINVQYRFMIKTKPIEYGDPNNGYTVYSTQFEGSFNEALLQ